MSAGVGVGAAGRTLDDRRVVHSVQAMRFASRRIRHGQDWRRLVLSPVDIGWGHVLRARDMGVVTVASDPKPRLFDLFCGAGGASTGLAAAGCDVTGFELDADAASAHHANGHSTVRCDLNGYPWRGTCDLLWASPPCQPFSAAGKRRGSEDDSDGMPAFLHAVESLLPPVVVMENVPGLLNRKHLDYRAAFTNALMRCGYDYQSRVLNCADFGVPQTRERFILIARRDGRRIRWPQRTHAERSSGLPGWVSMADALGWTARSWTLNTGRDWKPGGSRDDAQTMVCDSAPAPTFSAQAGGQWHLHPTPTDIIRITVEQAATLQGFPPGYRFVGSRTAQFQQVGNAVPPPLARAVVEALLCP